MATCGALSDSVSAMALSGASEKTESRECAVLFCRRRISRKQQAANNKEQDDAKESDNVFLGDNHNGACYNHSCKCAGVD